MADGECTEGQGGCRKRPINDGQHRCMAYLVSTHWAIQLSRILNPEYLTNRLFWHETKQVNKNTRSNNVWMALHHLQPVFCPNDHNQVRISDFVFRLLLVWVCEVVGNIYGTIGLVLKLKNVFGLGTSSRFLDHLEKEWILLNHIICDPQSWIPKIFETFVLFIASGIDLNPTTQNLMSADVFCSYPKL